MTTRIKPTYIRSAVLFHCIAITLALFSSAVVTAQTYDCKTPQGAAAPFVQVQDSKCDFQAANGGYCMPFTSCGTSPVGSPGAFYKSLSAVKVGTCGVTPFVCFYCAAGNRLTCMYVEWYSDAACTILVGTGSFYTNSGQCS